jgi:hypothetical protein
VGKIGNLPAEGPAAPHPAASGPSFAGLAALFLDLSQAQPGSGLVRAPAHAIDNTARPGHTGGKRRGVPDRG